MTDINKEFLSNNIINQNLQKPLLNVINEDNVGLLEDILKDYKSNFKITEHIHQKTTKINFDSRDRNRNPKNILDNNYKYINNALRFVKDEPLIYINCENHGLTLQDKIILQNVKPTILRMKGNIEIKSNSSFIKIIYNNHGFTDEISKYRDNIIELKGITGNLRNNSYINNIPISLINKRHKVFLKSDIDKLGSEN